MTTETETKPTALAQAITEALREHEKKAFAGETLKFRSALRGADGAIINKGGKPYTKPEKGEKRPDSESQADWEKKISPADLTDAQLCDLFLYGVGRRFNDFANASYAKLNDKTSDGLWEYFLTNVLGQESKRGPIGPQKVSPEALAIQNWLNTENTRKGDPADRKVKMRANFIRAGIDPTTIKTLSGFTQAFEKVLTDVFKLSGPGLETAKGKIPTSELKAIVDKALEKTKGQETVEESAEPVF